MINRIVLVGRLTRDPEHRKTNSDVSVASFTLAVDDRVKENQTTFIGVSVFNQAADNVCKYCRKGSLVGVDGRIRQRTYETKDGRKGSVIEVIADSVQFLEPKSKEIPNEDLTTDIPNDFLEEEKVSDDDKSSDDEFDDTPTPF